MQIRYRNCKQCQEASVTVINVSHAVLKSYFVMVKLVIQFTHFFQCTYLDYLSISCLFVLVCLFMPWLSNVVFWYKKWFVLNMNQFARKLSIWQHFNKILLLALMRPANIVAPIVVPASRHWITVNICIYVFN